MHKSCSHIINNFCCSPFLFLYRSIFALPARVRHEGATGPKLSLCKSPLIKSLHPPQALSPQPIVVTHPPSPTHFFSTPPWHRSVGPWLEGMNPFASYRSLYFGFRSRKEFDDPCFQTIPKSYDDRYTRFIYTHQKPRFGRII